jgi:hypothetical protein
MKQDDEEHLRVENDKEKQTTASGKKTRERAKGTICNTRVPVPDIMDTLSYFTGLTRLAQLKTCLVWIFGGIMFEKAVVYQLLS